MVYLWIGILIFLLGLGIFIKNKQRKPDELKNILFDNDFTGPLGIHLHNIELKLDDLNRKIEKLEVSEIDTKFIEKKVEEKFMNFSFSNYSSRNNTIPSEYSFKLEVLDSKKMNLFNWPYSEMLKTHNPESIDDSESWNSDEQSGQFNRRFKKNGTGSTSKAIC